jgi:hypothetical protein
VVEVEDARRYNGKYPPDNRDFNEFEPIQMYGELYFDEALGADGFGQKRPLSLRAGRMWFELLDRRLLANNAWRNTTNTFQGVALTLGRDANDWRAEVLAVQPLDRKMYDFDQPNAGQWFFAGIGHWRRWSDRVTLEPYFLTLSQDDKGGRPEREIYAPSLRFYGPVPGTGFNYDFDLVYQFGKDSGRNHSAFGGTAEVGHTWQHPWRPRLSGFYGYGSGDRDPDDNKNQRFERFYGFARPWSANDYFIWENLHAPKLRIEFEPIKGLRIDAGYNWYWLASDTDRWANANLRDPTGKSGSFLGHEPDIRARFPLASRVDATLGYARFTPGAFTRTVGRSNDSDFLYVELLFNAFPKP